MPPAVFHQPVAVLNPQAGGGRARRKRAELERLLAEKLERPEMLFTARPNHATELTRKALAAGADLVIAIGGDGTVNEVVNGFFDGGQTVNPAAALAVIPIGTGGDFQRTARLPTDIREAVSLIAGGSRRPIDVAKLRLIGHDGQPVERWFANLASFGMGGEVSIHAKNNLLTNVSGAAAFLWATFVVFLRYGGKTVRLTLDGKRPDEDFTVTNVAIGNGKYHGGGMHPCPQARLDSGELEVTVIDRLTTYEFMRSIPVLYSDDIYRHPKARRFRARRIVAESDETVCAEVDGEALGRLPLEAQVVPAAIDLIQDAGNPRRSRRPLSTGRAGDP